MSKPLTEQLRAYFDEVDRQQGAVDIDALRRSVEEREITIELSPDDVVPPNRPSSGRRWSILAVAAAVVLVVGALVVRDGDDATPADQPTVDTWLDELMVRPLDPPIDCGLEQCPWPPEFTAQPLDAKFACTDPSWRDISNCVSLAVSPDGTLVAFDASTDTLTWYEDEPRVVSLTDELPNSDDADDAMVLGSIGPYDIAYFAVGSRPDYLVAIAPSGAEITRVDTSATGAPNLYPTATGLGATVVERLDDGRLMPPNSALWMPWIDLDGNPIVDTRPYPTATVTDTGLEVRLGVREWLVATDQLFDGSGLLLFAQSDGGVVLVRFTDGLGPAHLFYLSTDGAIQRYTVDWWPLRVLPDGSWIIENTRQLGQLVRLTPPA